MLDRIADYADCFADPARWAIATIVEVSGSVPRPAGTSMAVRNDGRTIGSVSGGCVEGAVVSAALDCLETDAVELHSFGYADDDGVSVGLMCGGDVRVLVQPLRTLGAGVLATLAAASASASGLHLVRELPLDDARFDGAHTERRMPAPDPSFASRDLLPSARAAGDEIPADAVAVVFGGDDAPALGGDIPPLTADRIRAALHAGGAHVIDITDRAHPECPVIRRLLVESTATPARLIVYGANDFSAALAQAAAALGRHVTVCDARPVFATRERHPGAHEVVRKHPAQHLDEELAAGRIDARTAIVVLTHDPRFDLPVLDRALRLDVAYVGAMGSRITHEKRMQELRATGLPADRLALLHSPIGLDIGARTPAEVAVSILAELILAETAARTGIHAAPQPRLRDTRGDVHDAARTCAPVETLESEVPAWT